MKPRKITVAGQVFLWSRRHVHVVDSAGAERCSEKITLYLQGHKRSFLRLLFTEGKSPAAGAGSRWHLGGMAGSGIAWRCAAAAQPDVTRVINLNRPAVIKELILHFLGHGWQPATSTSPLEIAEALLYLDTLELPQG